MTLGNPIKAFTQKWTPRLLGLSIIGLGAGMNLGVIGQVGLQGLGYTVFGIATTLALGIGLGKLLRTAPDTSLLVSVGTAICGGSAIAAVASVIRAKNNEISIALGIVFLLNALALFIFPVIGHELGLNETQFGLWSALAIHDTSSVVGATLQYGTQALEVGTTVKLARSLWIVPVAFIIGLVRKKIVEDKSESSKAKKPWFILGFLLTASLVTFFPDLQEVGHHIESISKRILVLTLFFIGSHMTKEAIGKGGLRPFLQGFFLWVLVAIASLAAIVFGGIGSV